jgi:hypothetical protein
MLLCVFRCNLTRLVSSEPRHSTITF